MIYLVSGLNIQQN